jgi:hypothetical protein
MSRNREREPEQPDSFLYSLAHNVVRNLFFQDPRRFYRLAEKDWDRGIGDFTWDLALPFAARAGDWVGRRDQFKCRPVPVRGRKAVLLEFPAPLERTQCHGILAVLTRGKGMGRGRPGYGRYFTLERGRSKRDSVLGEWTADGCHVIYAEGPVLREDAFIAAVEEQLRLSGAPRTFVVRHDLV